VVVSGDEMLQASGITAFVLLAGMFGLSVVYGYAGLPHLRAGGLTTRAALGLRCLITGVTATVAVSLATVVELDFRGKPNRHLTRRALSASLP
jgi:hypothetical protein